MDLRLARVAATLSVVAVSISVAGGLTSARQFVSDRAQLSKLSRLSREDWDANDLGLNTRFLTWAHARITAHGPNETTFWLANSSIPNLQLWTIYQMVPAREVAAPTNAHWLISYDESFTSLHLDRRRWRVMNFTRDYWIAERAS
jgi:hypothetical protein